MTLFESFSTFHVIFCGVVYIAGRFIAHLKAQIEEKHKLSQDGDERQSEQRKDDKKELEGKLEKLDEKLDAYEEIRRLNDTKLYDRATSVEERVTRIEGIDEGYQRGLAEGRRK